jgi:hypothetical protein
MAKIRKFLYPHEADLLGLEVKPNLVTKTHKRSQARYYIEPEEWAQISELRNKGVVDSCNSLEVDPTTVKHLWKKTKDESLFVKNPLYKEELEKDFEILKKLIIKDVKKFSPIIKTIKREKTEESFGLVLDPADIHIGKLCTAFETGKEYNSQIAVKRVKEGVKGILNKVSGFNIDKIYFIIGNDILHTDTPKRTTTSGTPQDTDGMWYDNFLMAKQLYVDIILLLLEEADVEVIYNPSNHDYTNGFFLGQLIEAYFHKSKNITFQVDISHRKYTLYGNSLIGTTHGDGAKQTDLGSLMSIEAKKMWVESEFRYFYIHHLHHKISKDYINVTVETLRSPSTADSWHHRNGYINQPAIEGYLHSKNKGQIARFTHYF